MYLGKFKGRSYLLADWSGDVFDETYGFVLSWRSLYKPFSLLSLHFVQFHWFWESFAGELCPFLELSQLIFIFVRWFIKLLFCSLCFWLLWFSLESMSFSFGLFVFWLFCYDFTHFESSELALAMNSVSVCPCCVVICFWLWLALWVSRFCPPSLICRFPWLAMSFLYHYVLWYLFSWVILIDICRVRRDELEKYWSIEATRAEPISQMSDHQGLGLCYPEFAAQKWHCFFGCGCTGDGLMFLNLIAPKWYGSMSLISLLAGGCDSCASEGERM